MSYRNSQHVRVLIDALAADELRPMANTPVDVTGAERAGIELAPDAMYQRIRESGISILTAKSRKVA